jgi:pimeloyl-ACP methyl ester carboxylesterase
VEIFVDVVGEQRTGETPVVFLHGWGGSASGTWLASNLPHRLSERGRSCLLMDLPGHGARARLHGASHDSSDYDAIVDLVDQALPGAGPYDVVAFSLGAKIALVLASVHPGRIRRLVAAGVGSNIFAKEPAGAQMQTLLSEGFGPDTPYRFRRSAVYALQSGGDPQAMGACLAREWLPPTVTQLGRVTAPVLLASGDEDDVVGSVDELALSLRDVRVHKLPGIDHLSTPFSRELHELAMDFLTNQD